MPFTLLHTADIHLGKSFGTLPPERAEQRRADLLATLTRLCHRARELRVDLLCVAGDLFDMVQPSIALLAAARAALAEAEVPVLLIPGNHDPLAANSPYLESRWPGNVVVAAQPGWQRMPMAGQEIWAFGYTRDGAHRSPWLHFPGCGADALLALHAACLAPGLAADAGYYPFPPTEIPQCAYLALGHHHRPVLVNRRPSAWYAGSPEPLVGETTPAITLLVTLDGSTAAVEPLDVATRRHRLVTLDVTGMTADAIWDRALAAASVDDLLTISLTGMLEAVEPLDLFALREELSHCCFAAEVDAQGILLPSDLPGEGVAATVLRLGQERMQALKGDDLERQRIDHAVRYALLALEGKL